MRRSKARLRLATASSLLSKALRCRESAEFEYGARVMGSEMNKSIQVVVQNVPAKAQSVVFLRLLSDPTFPRRLNATILLPC